MVYILQIRQRLSHWITKARLNPMLPTRNPHQIKGHKIFTLFPLVQKNVTVPRNRTSEAAVIDSQPCTS